MSTSRNTGHSTGGTARRQFLGGLRSISRYDFVLAAIPLIFAVALSLHVLVPVSLPLSVSGGSLVSTLFLVDAIYLNPPTDSGSDGATR